MAKGNMLLGYSRGSVGDVVFSRLNGEQLQRARNRNPNNPKTYSQVSQRSDFTSLVKFYVVGAQNFFKYAFESKRSYESDYNAFIRYNKGMAVGETREQIANNVAVPGLYCVSAGSLNVAQPFFVLEEQTVGGVFSIDCTETDASLPDTVAGLTRLLVDNHPESGYSDGDILTFYYVFYLSTQEILDGVRNGLVPSSLGRQYFILRQIVLNRSDNTTLASLGMSYDHDSGDPLYINLASNPITLTNYTVVLGAMTASRERPNAKLQVSTSYFQPVAGAKAMLTALSGDNYRNAVMQSWGYNPGAVLQGNLNTNT